MKKINFKELEDKTIGELIIPMTTADIDEIIRITEEIVREKLKGGNEDDRIRND